MLKILASVFLDGASVFGCTGTILGTFFGSVFTWAIEAAIVAIGLTAFWTQLIYGPNILVSVSVQAILRRRNRSSSIRAPSHSAGNLRRQDRALGFQLTG